ncbi:MAG TPA: aminoacyl-tRNA hydrolase [Spirochaetia bacterium]|nr:aminoacyl-tRNA hydrolase [Spirochaetia bacterium]
MLVIGLGNPGSQYARTRHNVGFFVADETVLRLGVRFRKSLLRGYLHAHAKSDYPESTTHFYVVKPVTFMNRSGRVVPGLLKRLRHESESMLVVCDTLDLPIGVTRLKRGGSSAGHRGLSSIIEELGSESFLRLMIGIGRPPEKSNVVDFVLGDFSDAELTMIGPSVRRAADAIMSLANRSVEEVMNELNRRNSQPRNGS